MSGLVILKYFHPILDKKDPPEDKELYSIHLGHYRRLYPSSLVATELYIILDQNDVLPTMANSIAQRHEISKKGAEIGVTLAIYQSLQPS